MMQLGAGGEFDLIRELARRWGASATGLGDDAATLELPRGERVVVSTDAAVEDVHFRSGWLTLAETGYRAVTAALSDLAAMAATPRGILVSFTVPVPRRAELLEIADGIGEAARSAGTTIIGGNISAGAALTITTTVVGSAFAPVSRADARPGDTLWVTGTLGGPAAAVRALSAGTRASPELHSRFVRPAARLREARWLAARGCVAAIDVSDGLVADAGHLAAASGVSLEIEAEKVPVMPGATGDDALAGGEEYELLVAAREALDASAFTAAFGIPITRIGAVVAKASRPVVLTRGGLQISSPMGHDHFAR